MKYTISVSNKVEGSTVGQRAALMSSQQEAVQGCVCIGNSNLTSGMNVSVNCCLFLCVGLAMSW